MKLESRHTHGKPSLVLIPETLEESRLIDACLGDKLPAIIQGMVKLADGYGQHYIALWNPLLNDMPGPIDESGT